jgi:hypothetical protein
MSHHKNGHDVFDVLRLIDAYDLEDLYLRKITFGKIYKVENIDGIDNNEDCSICLKTFADGEHVESLPCQVSVNISEISTYPQFAKSISSNSQRH